MVQYLICLDISSSELHYLKQAASTAVIKIFEKFDLVEDKTTGRTEMKKTHEMVEATKIKDE